MISEGKYQTFHVEGIKILTPKYMLQRSPKALEQVKSNLKTY